MKKHLVKIFYALPDNRYYCYCGFVNEVIGDNGKAVVFPSSIFKKAFGFKLPVGAMITIY